MNFIISASLFLFGIVSINANGLSEQDRLREYDARGYEWPLKKMSPDTPGWRNFFKRRFTQIEEMDGSTARYNAWMQAIAASMLQPNFTENGYVFFSLISFDRLL